MTLRPILFIVLGSFLISACGWKGPVGNPQVPEPAKPVRLESYLGRWYELARYENHFEEGCEGVTADYSLREDGMIRVVNTCREGSVEGASDAAEGKAKIVDGSGNAKLRVSFFGPFYGDYWVLDHAEDYSWSIVGEPTGRYLWILTREAVPGKDMADRLYRRAEELGYDLRYLRKTQQPPG